MEFRGLLDFLPLWGLFAATVAVVFLAVECGYRVGKFRRQGSEPEKESPVGAMVGATLGLLAFMLAFTFGLAASRFDDRRQIVVEEANAIGTCYLRAEMLAEPQRSEIRKQLHDYVDVRLEAIDVEKLQQAIAKSSELHNQLWSLAVAVAQQDTHSIVTGLFIESLNEVIDLHSKRLMVAVRNRIPGTIWLTLYLVAVLAMAEIGYHEGLTSTRRSLAAPALVLTFSMVMSLIADLDRPQEGLLRVSQQAMLDLQNSFNSASAGTPGQQP